MFLKFDFVEKIFILNAWFDFEINTFKKQSFLQQIRAGIRN